MDSIIQNLEGNRRLFIALFQNLNAPQILWKPSAEKWNALEIICHLVDEEKDDFRARLQRVLEDPSQPFVPIDPPGWVIQRNYAEQQFSDVVENFNRERIKSIEYLKNLENPTWSNVHVHPTLGPMSAKFILANWLAHDYLHLRQLIKLQYDYLNATSGESLNYTGNW